MQDNLKRRLANQALTEALKLRSSQNVKMLEVFDIYTLSLNLGLEIRFVDIPSLEAMYIKKDRLEILISSHRPAGRQVYSCAHELGHHVFDHGSKIDEIIVKSNQGKAFDREEYLADRFASFFLMPKSLVNSAFTRRGWNITESSEREFYTVASWIGVGYSTLVYQARLSLNLISKDKFNQLIRAKPKNIRKEVLGSNSDSNVIVVDSFWRNRAIDIQANDYIFLANHAHFEGDCVKFMWENDHGSLYRGIMPGIGRFEDPLTDWASYVRVSRKGFVGRAIFRHLEDPEYKEG